MLKRVEGMEECEKRVLCQFWTRLVNEIVVTASFLSAFCEQSVLDEEMTKIVKVRTQLGVGRGWEGWGERIRTRKLLQGL